MPITVVIVEDHLIVREGLRALFKGMNDFRLIAETGDGREALHLVEDKNPDVLIADLAIPSLPGFDLTRQVKRRSPKTQVVVLSMHADAPYVLEALRAGAMGYVVKDAGSADLLAAVRAAAEGKRYLSPPLSEATLGSLKDPTDPPADPYESLTAREREVLRLTADGLSGAAVAKQLLISPRTVETHRANIMRKLGVKNQKGLIRYAVQRGISGKR